jgi:hypothetical protein
MLNNTIDCLKLPLAEAQKVLINFNVLKNEKKHSNTIKAIGIQF